MTSGERDVNPSIYLLPQRVPPYYVIGCGEVFAGPNLLLVDDWWGASTNQNGCIGGSMGVSRGHRGDIERHMGEI